MYQRGQHCKAAPELEQGTENTLLSQGWLSRTETITTHKLLLRKTGCILGSWGRVSARAGRPTARPPPRPQQPASPGGGLSQVESYSRGAEEKYSESMKGRRESYRHTLRPQRTPHGWDCCCRSRVRHTLRVASCEIPNSKAIEHKFAVPGQAQARRRPLQYGDLHRPSYKTNRMCTIKQLVLPCKRTDPHKSMKNDLKKSLQCNLSWPKRERLGLVRRHCGLGSVQGKTMAKGRGKLCSYGFKGRHQALLTEQQGTRRYIWACSQAGPFARIPRSRLGNRRIKRNTATSAPFEAEDRTITQRVEGDGRECSAGVQRPVEGRKGAPPKRISQAAPRCHAHFTAAAQKRQWSWLPPHIALRKAKNPGQKLEPPFPSLHTATSIGQPC